ncbi:MAG TPA: hypothetical protein VJ715_03495 [Pyrinomonadaceae bacterium]|nr:hypothetical protein [Pyrinomonadaceae bacterium]
MDKMKSVLKSLKGRTLTINVDLAAGVIDIKLHAPNAPESYDSILEVGADVFKVNHKSFNINTAHYLRIDKVIQVEAP